MKKTLLYSLCSLALAAFALPAWGQQINGDFDGDWAKCTPWDSKGNTKQSGTQPSGWRISNVYASIAAVEVGESVEDKTGGKAVMLTNKEMMGQLIPAYLTLGTPWATAETKGTSSVRNADGGTFGGQGFTYKPDALSFDYKRDNSKGTTEKATVVAYLWNGTWTQKDVPGNTAVGVLSWGSATKVSMVNRDRNVLGMKTTLGGNVSYTDGAKLVASLQYSIAESTKGEWQHKEILFDYNGNEDASVENINVIFSANDYFGDRGGIKADNSLTVDNVKLLYYHELADVSYDKKSVTFDKENYASVDALYDESLLTYKKVGAGATVEKSYDKSSGLLSIIVYGNDYDAIKDEESKSLTVYTIKFNVQDYVAGMNVSSTSRYATFVAPFAVKLPSGVAAYTCSELKEETKLALNSVTDVVPANTPVILYASKDVSSSYSGASNSVAEVYPGDLVVEVYGSTIASKSNVVVVNNTDGTFNFILKNFVLKLGDMTMPIGNIVLTNLPKNDNGDFLYEGNTTITAGDVEGLEWGGPTLGVVPLKVTNGNVTSSSLNVSLDIPYSGLEIKVSFASTVEPIKVSGYVQPSATFGLLSGSMSSTMAPIGSYVLQNQDGNVAFYKVFDGDEYAKPEVPANRCYLIAPASSEAGVKAISFPSDPTAIDAVKDLLSGKSEIYDLEGRRLPALQKGINIVNGKKVMVK